MNSNIIYKNESYKIIGACFEVYNEKGYGFAEPVYQECLAMELSDRSIPFQEQEELKLFYKGRELRKTYIPDYICFDKIILEIKAVKVLTDEHRAQILNYLKSTGKELGILVNFGNKRELQQERFVNQQ